MAVSPKPMGWSDPAGWDKYYSDLIDDGDYAAEVCDTGSISIDRIPQLITDLKSRPFLSIWIPGCGISLMPRLLYRGGLQVHATDISSVAIEFQNSGSPLIERLVSQYGVEESDAGTLTVNFHDFRTPYLQDKFDFIINVKAIQAFSPDEMREIAGVHFESLRDGGQAIFDTVNVQGESRETLESVLVGAGFYLPFYQINVEYRRRLNETGFPYVFVLGQPIIPRTGAYEDETKRERDMNVLRDISADHAKKLKLEAAKVETHYKEHPETKTASIIYSTG